MSADKTHPLSATLPLHANLCELNILEYRGLSGAEVPSFCFGRQRACAESVTDIQEKLTDYMVVRMLPPGPTVPLLVPQNSPIS